MAERPALRAVFRRRGVALRVTHVTLAAAQARVAPQSAFRVCAEWLGATGAEDADDVVVFLCELEPGGRLGAEAAVVVGFVGFTLAGAELHVKYLCSFLEGLCVGSVLLRAAAHFGVDHGCTRLTLGALRSALPFYHSFKPTAVSAASSRDGTFAVTWRNLPALLRRLSTKLAGCKMRPLELVFHIYTLWLQFRSATRSRCQISFEYDSERFDAAHFLQSIETCAPFVQRLRECLPEYASGLLALARASCVGAPPPGKRARLEPSKATFVADDVAALLDPAPLSDAELLARAGAAR
jgi:GNAT superfamily N-acetyltransferase